MAKAAVSVTLDTDNLLWLRSQTTAAKRRSLSDTLDRIVTDARLGGPIADLAIRSVVGTVEVNPDDPDLLQADQYVRDLVTRSTRRPFVVKETPPPPYGTGRRRRRG